MRKLSYVGGEKGIVHIGYFTNSAFCGSVTGIFQKMGYTLKTQDLKLYMSSTESMNWRPSDGDVVRYYSVAHEMVGLLVDKWTKLGAVSITVKHLLANTCVTPDGEKIETFSGPMDIWMFTIHSE